MTSQTRSAWHSSAGLLLTVAALAIAGPAPAAQVSADGMPSSPIEIPASSVALAPPPAAVLPLSAAQRHFYNAAYASAAEIAQAHLESAGARLEAYELWTAALHFQLRRAIGDGEDRDKAFKACSACPALMDAFMRGISEGRALAKARLEEAPDDGSALFYLGKINLNYVWLQLGTLGRKTGWGEYWEARRSLDAVLKKDPEHVRAKVARAWIDYIVDTRMPRGFRWVLGGGNKKRALTAMREAAALESDAYSKAEATFALWDVYVREKDYAAALIVARSLHQEFPENRELARFISAHTAADASAPDPR